MVVELVGWFSVGVWGQSLHRHLVGFREDRVHYGPATLSYFRFYIEISIKLDLNKKSFLNIFEL